MFCSIRDTSEDCRLASHTLMKPRDQQFSGLALEVLQYLQFYLYTAY